MMFSHVAGIAGSLMLVAAVLSPSDVERIESYGAAWALTADDAQPLTARARVEFAGRGTEIANRFLLHTDAPPRNDAYFFVLRAVGDTETALTLIRALSGPPPRASGILDRHFGEIGVAIEAVLAGDEARGDPKVVVALEEAVATARRKPYGSGADEALEAVRLIGMCASDEAVRSLARFAADSDAAIRAAAAAAIGTLVPSASTATADPVSPSRELLRIVASDPSPFARREAATSLGSIDAPEVAPGLRAALAAEQDPRVVDAVVQSLRRRGVLLDNPVECRSVIGRTWEAAIAEQMLDCWRRSGVSNDELQQMALTGGATERAVALFAVSAAAVPTQSLLAAGASEPALFEPSLRSRLLDASVWVLSQGAGISSSTRERAEQALWNLSERNMRRALAYADRVTPHDARFRTSAALARADAGAYDATRRWPQAAIAAAMAIGFGLLGIVRSRLFRPAVLMAASLAGWAVWILQANGVRDLPPPPVWILSVAAIAFVSAGATASTIALITRGPAAGLGPIAVRAVLTMIVSGVVAGVVCGATRIARLFPSGLEGWELIFDPLAASIFATGIAAMLVAIDHLPLLRRQYPNRQTGR